MSTRADELIGTVAIVGFPNVGKSTLVNRLTETRAAVVHETPGVTRDRKELEVEWNGRRFLVIDTGGIDIADDAEITRSIADQAREAVEEADLVLFVVDARIGTTPGDEEVAEILRLSHKPVLVLANKIDDPAQEANALEFHRLGLGDPIPLSAMHGHGTGDLLDDLVDRLEGLGGVRPELPEDAIRVAILGRPNVGKSSLLNALLGRERVIVSEVPGTTRDSIDTVLERDGRTFVLVDTAGLRRKRRHRQGIEYYSELRAIEAAERADVALVLIDSSEGIVEQDVSVADVARKANNSTLVVLSKWDETTIDVEDTRKQMIRRLRQRPPIIAVSAKTGRGINRLLDEVEKLFEKHTSRVPTPELNRFLGELREARQPPSRNGRSLNLLYGTQVETRPPRFKLFVNDPALVTRDYGYWVENNASRAVQPHGRPGRDRLRAEVNTVVVGAGSWGTAFARLLADRGHEVTLAARDPEQVSAIEQTGRNPRYLTNVDLEGIRASTIDDAPFDDAELVVAAVPSRVYGSVVPNLPGNAPVLSLTKGLDPSTGERLSTLVRDRPVAVLSGPNMAEEIAAGLPTAAVIASEDVELAERLQSEINSLAFRVYSNPDLVGVELCAAAKNVIGLAAGGVDGLGLGDNAKAALMTRGLAEMGRLGEAAGGDPDTFAGLAGMGDLIVTCWHPSGRNRRAGELIARGKSPDEAAAEIGQTVEGLTTAPVLRDLSQRLGVELPITEGVCTVLSGMPLSDLLASLMGRRPTEE